MARCLKQLWGLLTAEVAATEEEGGATTVPALRKLPAKDLGLSVWAVAQLQRARGADARPVMGAMVQQVELCPVMSEAGWFDWSRVLYAAAKAGVTCKDSPSMLRLFDQAFSSLPGLLATQPDRTTGQDISNMLWAAAVAGYSGPLVQPLVAAVVQAVQEGQAMGDAVPQNWSNALWSIEKLFGNLEWQKKASSGCMLCAVSGSCSCMYHVFVRLQ